MLARGMMDEVRRLLEAGHDDARPPMDGIGYRQLGAGAAGPDARWRTRCGS